MPATSSAATRSGVDLSNGFRWGVGAGLPSRGRLRLTAELHGESYANDTLTLTTPIIGQDGSISPLVTDLTSPVNATFGLTFQARNGFFAGAGINWNLHMDAATISSPGSTTGRGIRAASRCASAITRACASMCRRRRPRRPPPPPPPPQHNAVGDGAVRPVHGGRRQGVDGHGDGARLDRLRGDVCVERADGHVHERRRRGRRRGRRRCRKGRCR